MKDEVVQSMANDTITSKKKTEKEKILIFGATGYLGMFMVKASISMGHPTLAYVRSVNTDPSKQQLLREFELMNVAVVQVPMTKIIFSFIQFFCVFVCEALECIYIAALSSVV